MKKRQKVYWKILRPLVIVFTYLKFGYTFKTAKNLPDKFIVLSNHNTDFDPLFVGVSFKNSLRFVASEHISRWKTAFKYIDHIFSPIMRPKGTNAASTVKEMLRALRGGDCVCMFAEGARSWNGITAPILPSTGKVVKSSHCALVTYKIVGGYFTSPLWSKGGTRKGKIHGEIVNIYSADDIANMSADEINSIINTDLYENAYERQALEQKIYKGRCLAERIELMSFYCPNCNAIDSLQSCEDTVTCKMCGNKFTYDNQGNILGIDQKNCRELFALMRDKVLFDAENNITYTSSETKMITVKNHVEAAVSQGELLLSAAQLVCGDFSIDIADIEDLSMHGTNALVLSTKDAYYEILVNDNTSTLKFYMLFQAYKYNSINRFNF